MSRRRIALATTLTLVAALVATMAAPAAAQFEQPFVTVDDAPAEAALEVGEHIDATEFTDTRPLSEAGVETAPAILADDVYGCVWASAAASGADEWIGVARRGEADPGDPEATDRCPGFQTKFSAAAAAGASGLVVVNFEPTHADGWLAVAPIPGVMVANEPGERLIASLDASEPGDVQLSLGLLDPQTLLPPWEKASSEVTQLDADVVGDTVEVSGQATFRGEPPVVVGFDAEGNAPIAPELRHLGLDATEIALRQAHPGFPEIEFVIRVTDLHAPPPPEVVRYLWQFEADGEEYWVQAKTSDVTTATTFADDPDGTLTNIPGSFRLRGDCGVITPDEFPGPVRSCQHLAWLDGEFDTTRDEVRVRVPFHLVDEFGPGAVLDQGIMDASIQAVVSSNATSNQILQHAPYEIPHEEVEVGIVPAGEEPTFTDSATLGAAGAFSATLDASGLDPGAYDVWVRACFGVNCGEAVTTIQR